MINFVVVIYHVKIFLNFPFFTVLNSHKDDFLTVHCISGTFPTKDVSKKSDMAVACMTHCNGALDCGAIFIQVRTFIFFGVLTYIANTYIMLQQHSSCDEKLFLSV